MAFKQLIFKNTVVCLRIGLAELKIQEQCNFQCFEVVIPSIKHVHKPTKLSTLIKVSISTFSSSNIFILEDINQAQHQQT